TSSTFVIQTEERGRQTVVVSSDTKITVGGMPIVCVKAPCPAMPERIGSFADLQVGMKVIVRGLWDKALSKIQARLIVVAGAFDPRPFFQKENGLLKKFEKKHEDQIEKKEKKLEKQLEKKIETLEKPGEKDGILKRIEELNRMILEIQKKMGTASGSATTAPTAQ
ncbi:MAG: hypothetical protein HZA37_02630, partial [Parcubacteria group bacterium]|nr:hypothetical protein [Parcubacteria group bacterium]